MRPAFALADVGRVFDEARNHEDGEDADRDVDVEGPAPGYVIGEPAAERGAEDGRDDDAEGEDRHGDAAFLRRENFRAGWLGRAAGARRRRRLGLRGRRGCMPRVGAAPQAKDEMVKMTMQVRRKLRAAKV